MNHGLVLTTLIINNTIFINFKIIINMTAQVERALATELQNLRILL